MIGDDPVSRHGRYFDGLLVDHDDHGTGLMYVRLDHRKSHDELCNVVTVKTPSTSDDNEVIRGRWKYHRVNDGDDFHHCGEVSGAKSLLMNVSGAKSLLRIFDEIVLHTMQAMMMKKTMTLMNLSYKNVHGNGYDDASFSYSSQNYVVPPPGHVCTM